MTNTIHTWIDVNHAVKYDGAELEDVIQVLLDQFKHARAQLEEAEQALKDVLEPIELSGSGRGAPLHIRHKNLQAGHAALILERNKLLKTCAAYVRKYGRLDHT